MKDNTQNTAAQQPQVTHVHNLVILDASGSMHSIRKQAVDNLNETIQTVRNAAMQYADTQEHTLTFATFNSSGIEYIYNQVNAFEAEDVPESSYNPNGCTPLHDAMGQTMTDLEMKAKEGDRVLVTIITDGYENASREYTGREIKHMCERLRAKGWLIAYIGANQDVEAVTRDLGIKHAMAFEATPAECRQMSNRSSKSMQNFFRRLDSNLKALVCEEESLDEDYFVD